MPCVARRPKTRDDSVPCLSFLLFGVVHAAVRIMPKFRWNRYSDLEIDLSQCGHGGSRDTDPVAEVDSALRMWHSRISGRHNERSALFWVRVPVSVIDALPHLLRRGFHMHHATDAYCMLVLRNSRYSVVPSYGTHYVRVECLVYQRGVTPDTLLMVREKAGPVGPYKLVTGSCEPGEGVAACAEREVKEETGIKAEFIGVLGSGIRVGTRFGRDEVLFGVLLSARADQSFRCDSREISSAAWVPSDDVLADRVHSLPSTSVWIKARAVDSPLRRKTLPDLRGPPYQMEAMLPFKPYDPRSPQLDIPVQPTQYTQPPQQFFTPRERLCFPAQTQQGPQLYPLQPFFPPQAQEYAPARVSAPLPTAAGADQTPRWALSGETSMSRTSNSTPDQPSSSRNPS